MEKNWQLQANVGHSEFSGLERWKAAGGKPAFRSPSGRSCVSSRYGIDVNYGIRG